MNEKNYGVSAEVLMTETPYTEAFQCKDNKALYDVQSNPALEYIKGVVESPQQPEGLLIVKSANQWVKEASERPNPEPLWLSLWYQGEVCCLFADSNLGKSIYAVEIANEVSQKRKVLYFDFELSDKQFQLRYTDDFGGLHSFSDNFLRAEINPEMCYNDSFEDELIESIEKSCVDNDVKTLIVDNLSFLCAESEKGDAAGRLMMRLIRLKKQYDLSILVLAHTPKRPLSNPITQNDLAGSKKLFNFFDSVFAIGQSAKDDNLRYIKQIKVRTGSRTFGAESVLICEIIKDKDWLHFRPKGCESEKEHLKTDSSAILKEIKNLREDGQTIEEIAKKLNISKSKVGRIAKKISANPDADK